MILSLLTIKQCSDPIQPLGHGWSANSCYGQQLGADGWKCPRLCSAGRLGSVTHQSKVALQSRSFSDKNFAARGLGIVCEDAGMG